MKHKQWLFVVSTNVHIDFLVTKYSGRFGCFYIQMVLLLYIYNYILFVHIWSRMCGYIYICIHDETINIYI